MKKIVFTCNRLGYGGAERVICSLCNELASQGVSSYIVCLDIIEGFHYSINDGVQIVELDKNLGKRTSWILRKFYGLINLLRLFRFLKAQCPDVVISFYSKQNCYSIFCSKLLRIPVICAERDHFFLTDGKLNHLLRSFFYNKANGFIHQTDWVKHYLEEHYNTTKDSIVLHNPLWIRSFPERKPIKGNIIAVGRLSDQKNYKGLIRSFKEASMRLNENLSLSIYGEGPSREELEQFILEEGVNDKVFLKGQINNILDEYARAEMFVLFSHGEGYPNVLLEALACGVPCISSDCPIGGPASMIENGINGFLVENGNEDELTSAMIKLHESDTLKKQFSEKSIDIRNTNSIDVIFSSFYNYLHHICNSHNKMSV